MVRIPMLSTVALLEDLPLQSLRRGQVGTVVEVSETMRVKLNSATTTVRHTHRSPCGRTR